MKKGDAVTPPQTLTKTGIYRGKCRSHLSNIYFKVMKKCWLTRRVFTRESLHKYLLLLKLTAFFLLIACMQVSARGYSQDKMSISLRDVKLKYAISYIQHNSKYRFIY